MPTVKENESESDFIQRCIPYHIKEHGGKPSQEQAYIVCKAIYKKQKAVKNVTSSIK